MSQELQTSSKKFIKVFKMIQINGCLTPENVVPPLLHLELGMVNQAWEKFQDCGPHMISFPAQNADIMQYPFS
jgi:hypothetical protein